MNLLGGLDALSLLAAWIVRHPGWRRWYVVTAITEGALMFLAIHLLNNLNRWEELEIFAVAAGVGLLAAGHIGWYREQDSQEDMVSFSLGTGALLVAAPLAIAVLVHRSSPDFSPLNEFGMLRRACCCWPADSCSRSAPRRSPGPGCWRFTW